MYIILLILPYLGSVQELKWALALALTGLIWDSCVVHSSHQQ